VQCLKAAGTSNPLVLIDEIDKVLSFEDTHPTLKCGICVINCCYFG
jgi:ATP-dependent Lon protease